MEVVERFKTRVTLTSLALVGVGSVLGAFLIGLAFTKGLLGGGLAACALFLVNVRISQRVVTGNGSFGLYVAFLPMLRLAVYALILWRAYLFDTRHWMGFTGAVIGLSVVYAVSAVVGYTGWDLRKNTE